MNLAVVALVGRLLLMFAAMMAVPLLFALATGDAGRAPFAQGLLLTAAAGAAASLAVRRLRRELQPRDGFALATLTWVLLPLFGALPLCWALPTLSFTDAYFEAMSGFTATGATVLSGLDALPLSVNVWRCFLQWVGGLGLIVLVVAVLPLLGVGGSQLFRAEISGPMKDQKLTPRIADTARLLWGVYFALSIACLLAYRWAGMDWPDAFMHMCSTLGLGGLSSHDASFGHWNSARIEAVAVVFMLLAGVNFSLYAAAWRLRAPARLWADSELRAYLAVIALGVVGVAAYLWAHGVAGDGASVLRQALFHVVSVATTTGYASVDYAQWPVFAPVLMLLLGCCATCSGSTGGGVKMLRMLLLLRQTRRELVRIMHPHVVNPVVLGGRAVGEPVLQGVIAFMLIYGATQLLLGLLLLATGLDPLTAFSAVLACVNNIGPGLGAVGPAQNYGGFSDLQTWVCSLAMLLGRLEMLSVLVLLLPQFWRR